MFKKWVFCRQFVGGIFKLQHLQLTTLSTNRVNCTIKYVLYYQAHIATLVFPPSLAYVHKNFVSAFE